MKHEGVTWNKAWEEHDKVKCDCTHYPKDHYGRWGWCDKCGCTWYYPNVRWVRRKQKEVKKDIRQQIS